MNREICLTHKMDYTLYRREYPFCLAWPNLSWRAIDMRDKNLSLAQSMHEKKVCCEKDNCSRAIDVKSTTIILSLLLLWTMAFVVVIRHVFASHNNTAQVAENTTDDVIHITNETSMLAEEQWKRKGGPSSEDRWRQEEAAKRRDEERKRSIFTRSILTLPRHVKFPAPATFSKPAARSSHTQLEIDGIIAKQNIADRKRLEDMFDGKYKQIDHDIQRGIENLADQYAIESETLKAHLVRMVKLYRVAGATIGFTGVWLVMSFSGLAICELIRLFFLGFCHYVVNHLV